VTAFNWFHVAMWKLLAFVISADNAVKNNVSVIDIELVNVP